MKKFLTALLCAVSAFTATFGFSACVNTTNTNKLSLYLPDGAPALSVARLMDDEAILDQAIEYSVVSASTIQAFVTGENPTADFCILPVNLASKLLGSGDSYKMLGAVTNGNLFILNKKSPDNTGYQSPDISTENISTLIGSRVGVINLANVPGLTFKAILNDNSLAYQELTEGVEYDENKVNLIAIDATQVLPTNDNCDYFIVPEPAATTKVNATQQKLNIAGSLQELYGQDGGYPQAVLVAKNSVISSHNKTVTQLIASFQQNKAWLTAEDTSFEAILNAITSHYLMQDTTPTFNANNLNGQVINNCGINFVSSANCKGQVISYIQKLNAITNNAWGNPAQNFFYEQ